jgi:hypothetical protein
MLDIYHSAASERQRITLNHSTTTARLASVKISMALAGWSLSHTTLISGLYVARLGASPAFSISLMPHLHLRALGIRTDDRGSCT